MDFVVDCSSFCFVDLFHSWMSEDTVNMWGYPVLEFFVARVVQAVTAIFVSSVTVVQAPTAQAAII